MVQGIAPVGWVGDTVGRHSGWVVQGVTPMQ